MDDTPNRDGELQTPVPSSLPHLASPRRSHTDFGYRHRPERQTDQRLKPSHGVRGPTVCLALPLSMRRALVRIPTAALTLAIQVLHNACEGHRSVCMRFYCCAVAPVRVNAPVSVNVDNNGRYRSRYCESVYNNGTVY